MGNDRMGDKSCKGKILKWCVLAVLVSYSAVMAVWANRMASEHECTGVEIVVESGGQPMDSTIRSGLERELRGYPGGITGRQVRELNTSEIERFITRRYNFESVNCMVSPHGKLVVRVVPLIPVMRVFYADWSYYINKEGKHVETNAAYYNDVPVVTGRFSRDFQPAEVLPLVKYITSDPILRDLTAMIVAEDRNNLLIVPRIKGHVVNMGDTTRLDDKKRALTLFYREVMPYKGWEEYDTVSVKFRGQVVATRRDKSKLNHSEKYEEEVDPEEATLPNDESDEAGHGHGVQTSPQT